MTKEQQAAAELFQQTNIVKLCRKLYDNYNTGADIEVGVTEECDAERLLEILHEEGFTWNSGHRLDDMHFTAARSLMNNIAGKGTGYIRMHDTMRVTISSTPNKHLSHPNIRTLLDLYSPYIFKTVFNSVNELL